MMTYYFLGFFLSGSFEKLLSSSSLSHSCSCVLEVDGCEKIMMGGLFFEEPVISSSLFFPSSFELELDSSSSSSDEDSQMSIITSDEFVDSFDLSQSPSSMNCSAFLTLALTYWEIKVASAFLSLFLSV